MDAAPAVGGKRRVVLRVDMGQPRHDEQAEHQELDHHEHVVGARALAHAKQQQPGDQADDHERGHVDQDRNPGDVGGGVEQAVSRGISAEQRGAITGRQKIGEVHAERAEKRLEVVAPGDRHGDVPHRVLENQVPADDPGNQLAERRVGIRVRAPRLGNHGGQFGVAEAGERAADAQQQERKDQGRTGAGAHHVSRRVGLPGGRGADRTEDPSADDGADRQHDEIASAQDALQRLRRFELADQKLRDRLPLKKLPHELPCLRFEP